MSTVQTTRPINLDYKSTPTVHEFRPALLTVLAVLGIVISLADVCMQLWIWYQQLRSQYPRGFSNVPLLRIWMPVSDVLAFLLNVLLFGCSLCLLSLRPWVRRGLLLYGVGLVVLLVLEDLMLGQFHVFPTPHRWVGSLILTHPFVTFTSWFQNPWPRQIWSSFIVAHWVGVVVAMLLPSTKFAFKKGTEYLHTAYTSLAGR